MSVRIDIDDGLPKGFPQDPKASPGGTPERGDADSCCTPGEKAILDTLIEMRAEHRKEMEELREENKELNEELKDTKEELKGTKEELKDTKEELKDTKEELKEVRRILKKHDEYTRGEEAPSKVGSYLVWQQPHLIYLAELVYRSMQQRPSSERRQFLERYGELIDSTAMWMADFLTYDAVGNRYIIEGVIPAQETLKASVTYNPPFELSYWHYALQTAQQWRLRRGLEANPDWTAKISKLSHLAVGSSPNGSTVYLAAESAPNTYSTQSLISDHPAVLGAMGVLPASELADTTIMRQMLTWIWSGWNWDRTWGWDYPMVAMSAARLGDGERAVDALLMDKRTNTYLPNGHNYQDGRLRCYLPGNGGLLTAVALMCAGWEGNTGVNPGFPDNGRWNVRWEGLLPMP